MNVIEKGACVGKGTRISYFSHVVASAVIGIDCVLGQNVFVGNYVKIGNKCKIQNNVSLFEGVELEDYVFCGPSMVFTNVINPRCKFPQNESQFYKKTLIKEGASIGANATIVCGNTLGRHCFIGSGAVVTKNVPDYAIIIGVPGRQSGWMSEGGKTLNFDENNEAYCDKSKTTYRLIDNVVTRISES
ncbi:N-acetyltransferase [bacterium]|jgi:UDP-2-acetamido-3-amino-2,3-dideoxy-glucuronate N-acetyltransferase|nr:N-acetyltransferase [bacterium]